MLAIKLRPVGKKKQISYRIVVLPKRSKLVGKFVDDLGWYNAHTNKFQINSERAKQWIANGAQPTDTIHNILIDAKVITGSKIPLHKKSKQEPKAEPVKSEAKVEAPAENIQE
ncbi:MAG TPA: 30S ribosomal protein S16 [Candidatus Paceibacterota bacterium]|nr:30S ribosomal protein S16 [Candidatus Paceibacterota bacterium]